MPKKAKLKKFVDSDDDFEVVVGAPLQVEMGAGNFATAPVGATVRTDAAGRKTIYKDGAYESLYEDA